MANAEKVQAGERNKAGLHVVPTTLFRPSVLEAQREHSLGSPLMIQPLTTRLLSIVAVLIAISLIVLVFRGEYTRKARVRGYLVPTEGLIKVYPREMGTIVQKLVVEGAKVTKGETLFVIAMERPSGEAIESKASAISSLNQRRDSLESELRQLDHLARVEMNAVEQRIAAMNSEQSQLGREIITQQRRVAAAEGSLNRFRKLHAEGIASEEQMQEKLKDQLAEQGKLQAMERTQISLNREIKTLQAQIDSTQLQASKQRASLERNKLELVQMLSDYESNRTFIVTAPSNGTATAVLADRGLATIPGQPLLSILPAEAMLEAHLLVPSNSVGFLRTAQRVSVRHEAFPYQRFGTYEGKVLEISRTLILPGETSLPVQLQEPAYRVTVRLDAQNVKAYGQEFPLKAGMLLDADIWLDRRKLYQWILDPIYSALGRV